MLVKNFPTLYGVTRTGVIKEWHIKVELRDGIPAMVLTHGKQGGKMQEEVILVTEGKNIGRANETTPIEQATADAESRWTKKKEREQYTETVSTAIKTDEDGLFPMLAQKYTERKHKVIWPAYVQPKLNGVRAVAHHKSNHNAFMSRKGLEYTGLKHISDEILQVFGAHVPLDGELFNPDLSLQEIVSRVKRSKESHPLVGEIQYHIYDCIMDGVQFRDRTQYLHTFADKIRACNYLKLVPTFVVMHEAEMELWNRDFLKNGYEGTMVRNMSGYYETNHRSNDLLKVKQFEEEEFQIVDVHGNGIGREQGLALFVCKTKKGDIFTVRPKGSFETRRAWLADRENIIGKDLTVRFLEWSADEIPQHPTGLVIRDYE